MPKPATHPRLLSLLCLAATLVAALLWAGAAAGARCSDTLDQDLDGLADYPFDPGCSSFEDDTETDPSLPCDDTVDQDGDFGSAFGHGWRGGVWRDWGCESPPDPSEKRDDSECDDGIDNDGDGLVDVPEDPGCETYWLWPGGNGTESPACHDGADNDADGLVDFPADPGCANAGDDDETTQCDDGLDNDADGLVDFPADPGCVDTLDDDEAPACQDGLDNDADTYADFPDDPGCSAPSDDSEHDPELACDDGIDGDSDMLIDFPTDPGCESPEDDSERGAAFACDNGIDDDGDGEVDFALGVALRDKGCMTAFSNDESPACDDGIDNDADGKTDGHDSGCTLWYNHYNYYPWLDSEATTCADGIDNDADGLVDFPQDPDCADPEDRSERNAHVRAIELPYRDARPGRDGKFYRDGSSYLGHDPSTFYQVHADGSRTVLLDPSGDGAGNMIAIGFSYGPEIDREGNRYFLSYENANVIRVSPDDEIDKAFGPDGDGSHEVWAVGGFSAAKDGNQYVWAPGAGPLFRIHPSGEIEYLLHGSRDIGLGHILQVEAGRDGTLFLSAGDPYPYEHHQRILAMEPSGEFRNVIDVSGDRAGNILLEPGAPGFELGRDGSVYVAGWRSHNVFRIKPSGEVTVILDHEGDGAGNRFLKATSLQVDSRGNVYVSGQHSKNVFMITRAGTITMLFEDLEDPEVVVGWDDAVYITNGQQNFLLELGPECNDGIDNDADGLTDFPADPGCRGPGWNREAGRRRPLCGLGFELALLLVPLLAWRRRRCSAGQPR